MGDTKKPRHVYGAGSVSQTSNGRWRVRVCLPNGERVGDLFDTEEEAEKFRATLVVERHEAAKRGKWAEPAKDEPLTLAKWGETWLKQRRDRKLVRWPEADEDRWNHHVKDTPLARMALVDVRTKHVRDWVKGMLAKTHHDKPLRTQTIRNAFNLIRKAFGDALDEELVASNPAVGVKVPVRDSDPDWTYLTPDEIRLIETAPAEKVPKPARLLYTVAIFTGLRAGELWALTWGDVQLKGDRPSITVRRSHKSGTKNRKVQVVPLFPKARAALDELERLAREAETYADENLIFPAPEGGQRARGDDAGWSSRIVRDKHRVGHRELAGIARRVKFHELRHTTASHLVMGTWTGEPWPIAEVCKFLRHSSVVTTQRYAHLAPDYLHDRVAKGTARPSSASPKASPAKVLPPATEPPTEPVDNIVHETPPNIVHGAHPRIAGTSPNPLQEGSPPGSPVWAAAVGVLEGGALRMRRAVELAGMVLDGVVVLEARAREGVSS